MKTKISHLGRSTVSVILAVMMLLSTMLIGTVSTVNAADLPNATKVYLASALATVDNKKLNTWGSICAYAPIILKVFIHIPTKILMVRAIGLEVL